MNRKEPLFRVVKRESSSPVRQALAYVAAVVIALLIGAAIALGTGAALWLSQLLWR